MKENSGLNGTQDRPVCTENSQNYRICNSIQGALDLSR